MTSLIDQIRKDREADNPWIDTRRYRHMEAALLAAEELARLIEDAHSFPVSRPDITAALAAYRKATEAME